MKTAVLRLVPRPRPEDAAAELIDRLIAGDDGALREAYRQHHDSVCQFANRLVNDVGAAEDLVHDVFVALPRAIRRFRREVPLRQFLIGMAVNYARHHVRAAVRRRRAHESLARQPLPPSVSPDRVVENEQLGRALVAALDRLPLDQRVAFVLCDVEQHTSAAAARIAGISDNNMRGRLRRARQALRSFLASWHKGERA